MSTQHFDIVLIGAGIVGLATALQISRQYPRLKVAVIEKESEVALHQTGHNSGVIHSGIYYKPGSLRATNCQRGYHQLLEFCDTYGIAYERCGKVIVATREEEKHQLDIILARGMGNGMQGLRKIGPEETAEIEPHVKAVEAIWVPQAGIVNYRKVALQYAHLFREAGGQIFCKTKVNDLARKGNLNIIKTDQGDYTCSLLINCAGLYSDKIALLSGQPLEIQIIPFR